MNTSVLLVGIATLDVVNVVTDYPQEDAEVRAVAQHLRRGGNSANSAVVMAQQGHRVQWLGTLADDLNARIILDDFAQHGVDTSLAPVIADSVTPTSYIAQSQATGSRTIVHYRRLPELPLHSVPPIDWSQYRWVHFEGRNETVILALLQQIQAIPAEQRPRVSIEIEKVRERELELLPFAERIFFSRDYVRKRGFTTAAAWVDTLELNASQVVVVPWGELGAFAFSRTANFVAAAATVPLIVDSIGAGDCFIAAFIAAQLRGKNTQQSLAIANGLAARKIGQMGFADLAIEA